jgi:hypothetical protein
MDTGQVSAATRQWLTLPILDEAERFVADTGCDALAVAIGTSHGAYKFTRKPSGDVLKMDLIEEIHRRLPNTHLVMHGSSSVPRELVDLINKYGGKMKESYGVPVEAIQKGIKHGVRKINVDTDNRLAMTGAVRKLLAESPDKFDPRDYMKPAREAMAKVVKERMIAFGQAGWADKVPKVSLDDDGQPLPLIVLQPAGLRTGNSALPSAQLLVDFPDHRKQVADQTDVGDFEDRRFGILVDGHDGAGILDAGDVLDRA